jgi:branched-chain amino acid transport system substrate-binding protein
MQQKKTTAAILILIFLAGLGASFTLSFLQNQAKLTKPIYSVGIVYPMSGRLDWWGKDAEPIIDSAKKNLQALLGETESDSSFRFIFADSNSAGEGALKAVQSLVAQGAQIIVGLPTSGEVQAVLSYVNQEKVPVISSASTASHLSIPDNVFRISTPENYRAKIGARFAITLGCKKVLVIYRDEAWGCAYAETVLNTFRENGLATDNISFPHPIQDI